MTHQDAFRSFFRGQGQFTGLGVPTLPDTYEWGIPQSHTRFVAEVPGSSSYERNVTLKHRLHEYWLRNPAKQRQLLEWIIKDWGGIRGNKPSTLDTFMSRMSEATPATPIQGLASFSKVLAISNPGYFAIYDARVAVSLNAIQLLSRVTDGMAFPYLPGRNKTTGDWSRAQRRGFSTRPEYSVKALCSAPHSWNRIPRDSAYRQYIQLLRSYTTDDFELYDLEMTLFSQAEILARRLMTH